MQSEKIAIRDSLSSTDFSPLTLVELLQSRASEGADRQAYIFLAADKTAEISLTYGELDRQARAIAAFLQTLDAAGERVLLLYPPGLDYIAAFFGCLYAGAIAVLISDLFKVVYHRESLA
ncbi:MAG: AMP-binding protein [Acidobacteria bacterium]|nr:AMP-binding protein [Acidobacteriota bacterium]